MIFYRVGHKDNQQGMWYDRNGSFAGRIHTVYSNFKNSELQMPFDPECVGYLSATEDLEQLFTWFPPSDILQAFKDGYRLTEYEVSETAKKFNTEFQHWLISEKLQPVKLWDYEETMTLMEKLAV